jgi:hypothetical protein
VWTEHLERVPDQPCVDDLETGIRYAPVWMLATSDPAFGTWIPIGREPAPGLELEATLIGKVESCVIGTVESTGQVQTLLLVRPDPTDTPPYR